MVKRASIAMILVLLLLALVTKPVNAVSWSAAKTNGITFVESTLDDSTYTWTLTNASYRPGMPRVIVWAFQPFNVPAPVANTEPQGWEWTAEGWQYFEIASPSKKYYTPPSIAPGQSAIFTYTFNSGDPIINPYDGDPNEIGFLAHIGQVEPGSGSLDGSVKWTPVTNPIYGSTWYDRSTHGYPGQLAPEPSALVVLSAGVITLMACATRRGRT